MRILPINYNLFIQSPAQNIQRTPLVNLNSLSRDTFEISFKGDLSYIEQAKEFNGIHCPICGHAMFSEKEFQELLKKAEQVETAQDFNNLVHEYQEFVPSGMGKILRTFDNLENMNFLEFFSKHSKGAHLKHKTLMEKSNNYLLEFFKTQPEENQKELQGFINTIKPTNSSYTYGQKLLPILKNLDISQQEYFNLLNNSFLTLQKSSNYLYVFKIPEIESKTPSEISKIMVYRIFSKSLMHLDKISRSMDLDNPNNEILTCESCHGRSKGKTFINQTALENPELKNNIKLYIQDISVRMGQKNLATNAPYITYLCNFINRISNNENLKFSQDEIKIIKKLNFIASRHNDFKPISQTKTDIPCAGCGSTLLPHEIKQQIEQELSERSSIKSYIRILKKYDKFIGAYARDNANLFIEIAENNPNISKEKLLELLQKEADKKTDIELNEIIKQMSKARTFITRRYCLAELENYDNIKNSIYKYIKNNSFKPDYNYMRFIDNALKDYDLDKNTPAIVFTFLNKIKIACHKNSIIRLNEMDKLKDKNPIQTIIHKMFNSDLATADHLVAMTKGGEKDTDNIIGLCKSCNKIVKGGKHVYSWFIQNPDVKTNLLAQLKVINSMAKSKEIEGYDDWAKNIAEQMYKLTYNKYDVRNEID